MMGDIRMFSSTTPMRKESLIAAHNLLKELEANESITDEMRKILLDIDLKLSMNLTLETDTSNNTESQAEAANDVDVAKERLSCLKECIMGWEENDCMISEAGPEAGQDYVESVQEVSSLVDRLRRRRMEGEEGIDECVAQGESLLQTAMSRLEEELQYILVQKRRSYDDPSRGGDDDAESEGDESDDHTMFDLIEPEVVPFLKSIKNIMFDAEYDQEFCATYTRIQREVLEDCLVGLGMEKHSIDELLRMDWTVLDSKIKTWVQVIKTAVHVYLRAEKRLCCQIFGESTHAASSCFVNTTKSSLSCLLIFGHAMSLGPHTPEKLFSLLDMYEALADVRGVIDDLYNEEDGPFVRAEFQEVMDRMGESAKATFLGFGNVILSDPSVDPFPGGGVHPLTSYVMNYIIVYLPDYCKTLDILVQDKCEDHRVAPTRATARDSVLGSHLRSLADKLKSNLEKKSHLYKDVALQNVFMMNNLHYIQHKVMGSELRCIIGDEWIRTQMVSYQQHATSYVRTTWSSVVAALRDDGIPSGSGSGVRAFLKEKIRLFSVAFEEVYRNQTGWVIRDEQLKEELRISISQKVILAYQSFIGRHNKYDIEKYVKYDSEMLEELLQDFFEGSPKSVNYTRRRAY